MRSAPQIIPKSSVTSPKPAQEIADANRQIHHDSEFIKFPRAAKHIQYTPGMMPPVDSLPKAKRVASAGTLPTPATAKIYNHPITSQGMHGNWLNLVAIYKTIDINSSFPLVVFTYTDHTTHEILSHKVEMFKLGYTTGDLDDVLEDSKRDKRHISRTSRPRATRSKAGINKIFDGMMQRTALWQLLNNPDEAPDIGTEGRG